MIYREIHKDKTLEYEGTPEEINEMLCMREEDPVEIKPIDIVITRKDDFTVDDVAIRIAKRIGRCMCSQ